MPDTQETPKVQVIDGPIAPGVVGGVIYHVTLPSGAIVTNPTGFGSRSFEEPSTIVTEDGRVLV
jgi:hypothetical protein